ncbi:MAG: lipid A biosynthesis protein [Rhodospirillaceae bacterium]|nr:MAG: lipid A biosynthesis protein [Rhodospirillaceae bacterium]
MTWFVAWFTSMNLLKVVGLGGQAIFGCRFLVQWLASERAKRSVIPVAFWYMSLFGGLLTLIYALYIHEPVFILSQIGGVVIYGRNLVLIYRDRRREHPLMGPDRG